MSEQPLAEQPLAEQPLAEQGDGVEQDGRSAIARLADEIVPTLIERLTNSELGELEVRENGWRIRLRRPLAGDDNGATSGDGRSAPLTVTTGTSRHHEASERHSRPDPPRGAVTSPAVGYFAPRDGVAVGSRLRNGDTIGHVDVLGVRREIVSPIDGTLRGLEVEPGQAVEYGQPIGRVEPDA